MLVVPTTFNSFCDIWQVVIDLGGTTCKGPFIKYVTFEGEEVREGVTVCDRGRVSRACDVTLIKNLYHTCTYGTRNLKRCLVFCCNRCILTDGERTKATPDKTVQTKYL